MNKKVGLLLPKSVLYPSIGFDLLGGLRHSLLNSGISDAEIKTDSIGLGTDDKQIYAACEKMLFDGISIVAGYVNPLTAEKLEPLFASANAVFIALDAGYHFPSSTAKKEHVFYLSLLGSLCIRTNVTSAIAEGKKNIGYTGSFYDSGYRGTYAAHRGIEDAGGNVKFNFITPLKRTDLKLDPLVEKLKEGHTDAVFASFCGDMLQDYFAAAAAGNIFNEYALYGSPFVGDEHWLERSLYPGKDVTVCVPWGASLNIAENERFSTILKEQNTNVNIFSLLGWETGIVAAHAMGGDNAIAVLEGFAFNSPRGSVTLDAATHLCHAPVYTAKVKRNGATGNCVLEMGIESPYSEAQRIALENDINSIAGPTTSWHNVYGCLDS